MFCILLFVSVAVACKRGYRVDFFPENAIRKFNSLYEHGTWDFECNGDPSKTLRSFPIQKVPDVCHSLQSLGFEERHEICSRAGLICDDSHDKIQWTNARNQDRSFIRFEQDIMDLNVTLFKNGQFSLKLGSNMSFDISKSEKKCTYQISSLMTVGGECGTRTYHFGFIKTKSYIYEYAIDDHHTRLTRLNSAQNYSHMEITQIGVNVSVAKMNFSSKAPFIVNPNGLDNLHEISEQMSQGCPWSCDLLDTLDCKTWKTSTNFDGRLHFKANIFIHIQLKTNLTLTIHQEDGQSHSIHMGRTDTNVVVTGPQNSQNVMGATDSPGTLDTILIVVHEKSIILLYTTIFSGTVANEFVIDQLKMDRVRLLDIHPRDFVSNMLLDSSKLGLESTSFDLSQVLVITTGLVIGIILMVTLVICWKTRKPRSKKPQINSRQNSGKQEQIKMDSYCYYSEHQHSASSTTKPKGNEEYYYTSTDEDYYFT